MPITWGRIGYAEARGSLVARISRWYTLIRCRAVVGVYKKIRREVFFFFSSFSNAQSRNTHLPPVAYKQINLCCGMSLVVILFTFTNETLHITFSWGNASKNEENV